ncbi:MAG: hypothetical protein Q4A29_08940 [Eubacteriales bacterium]|nr:hypothetical protein [Eubacteriales bacterium]
MILRKRQYEMKTVAVQVPERGMGATHICVCFAHALAALGKKVALIEWNSHQDFVEIEKSFQGFGFEKKEEQVFRIRRVDYYKSYQEKGLASIKKENYDYIIADMGNTRNSYFAEADYPVLILTGNEWKANRWIPVLKKYESELGERLKLIINFGNKEERNFFRKYCSLQIHNFPFWKDAFGSDREQRELLLQILGE